MSKFRMITPVQRLPVSNEGIVRWLKLLSIDSTNKDHVKEHSERKKSLLNKELGE